MTDRIEAGNIYVNRNMIGATVGVQPFGGSGLSGTGPKAGGPLYLPRLVSEAPASSFDADGAALGALRAFIEWLSASGHPAEAERCVGILSRSPLGVRLELSGPVGERNLYALKRRGRIAAIAADRSAGLIQIGTILATGNEAVISPGVVTALGGMPVELERHIETSLAPLEAPSLAGALIACDAAAVPAALNRLAQRAGPIVRLQAMTPERLAAGEDYDLALLVEERTIAINTAAAGGNASLMTIG